MTVYITFATIGTDAGPFNLYSDVDGFASAFEVGVTRAQLLAGFPSSNCPDGTTTIRAKSFSGCTNYYDMIVHSGACFLFLPNDNDFTYLLDYVFNFGNSYVYGAFDGYEETGIATTSKELIKLNLDLTIDTSFDVGAGFNEILYSGSSILQQADGKIIATGTFTSYQGISANRIIRLNTDGTRDNTFVIGSGFSWFTQIPTIDSLGRIIVTGIFDDYNGTSTPRIARLLTTGAIDPTFIVGTGFNNTSLSVTTNPDNSMIVTGYFDSYKGVACGNGITKLDSVGTVDPSFVVGTGFDPFTNNQPNYITRIDGDSSFFVGGYFTSYKGVPENYIIKLDQFGNKDLSFNPGSGFNNILNPPHIIWGNKLFITGAFTSYNGLPAYGLAILNADGSLLYGADADYYTPLVLGNNLVAKTSTGCLKTIFTNPVPITTTTTTPIPPPPTTSTTTSSTTVVPTTTTTTTIDPLFNASINAGEFFVSYIESCIAPFDFTAYFNGTGYFYDAGFTNPIVSDDFYWKFGNNTINTTAGGIVTDSNPCS